MKELWNELTKDEKIRVIGICNNVLVATAVAWIVARFYIPEFNGIFIPIREWKSVMMSSGYWEAYGINTVITLIMITTNWFFLTEEWRSGFKTMVRNYVSDLIGYFKR